MPKKEGLTTAIAREYRADYPDMPTLTLARLIYEGNSSLYTSVDHVRTALRNIEGKCGEEKRRQIVDKSLLIAGDRPKNPYNLPPSEEQDMAPYVLPKTCKSVLILSDIHIPYHNIEAVTLALDYGKQKNVDTIILNGDTIDAYQLSRFEKDGRKRSIAYELDATRSFLKTLRAEFPNAKIVYKCGNHDVRVYKYLLIKAPELLGVEEVELKNLLKLRDLDIDWVDDKIVIRLGKLNILHGHEFFAGSMPPVNIARGLFLKTNAIAIQGHNHKTSEHTVTTLDDNMITTWSTGCLCELKPSYMPYNAWNLGFAHVEMDWAGGTFEVDNKRIKSGRVF